MRPTIASVLLCPMLAVAAAPDVVFRTDFEGAPSGLDRTGRVVKPIRTERIAFAKGLTGQALVADTARVVYPADVIPGDAGTVEIVVSPLKNGLGKNWMAFCGDAESWGPVGVPKLWRWNGAPRFDLDGGAKSVCAGIPVWFNNRPVLRRH